PDHHRPLRAGLRCGSGRHRRQQPRQQRDRLRHIARRRPGLPLLARKTVTARVLESEYMYWAKNQAPVRYNLASSEVPHFAMSDWVIDPAMLELDGASRYRYPPLRAAIAR